MQNDWWDYSNFPNYDTGTPAEPGCATGEPVGTPVVVECGQQPGDWRAAGNLAQVKSMFGG